MISDHDINNQNADNLHKSNDRLTECDIIEFNIKCFKCDESKKISLSLNELIQLKTRLIIMAYDVNLPIKFDYYSYSIENIRLYFESIEIGHKKIFLSLEEERFVYLDTIDKVQQQYSHLFKMIYDRILIESQQITDELYFINPTVCFILQNNKYAPRNVFYYQEYFQGVKILNNFAPNFGLKLIQLNYNVQIIREKKTVKISDCNNCTLIKCASGDNFILIYNPNTAIIKAELKIVTKKSIDLELQMLKKSPKYLELPFFDFV
jgi:Zn-finger protein